MNFFLTGVDWSVFGPILGSVLVFIFALIAGVLKIIDKAKKENKTKLQAAIDVFTFLTVIFRDRNDKKKLEEDLGINELESPEAVKEGAVEEKQEKSKLEV